MTTEPVALTPLCPECGDLWLRDDRDHWTAYLTDDEQPELVFYCRDCAQQEFGDT